MAYNSSVVIMIGEELRPLLDATQDLPKFIQGHQLLQ